MLSSMVVELTFEGIHEDLIVQLPGTKPSLKGELQTLSIYFGDKKGEWELDEVVFVGKWPELFRVRAIWWWYHLVNMPRRVKTKYIDV